MKPNGPSLDALAVVSLVLEGIIYGASLILFTVIIRVLLRRDGPRRAFFCKLTTAIALCILSTIHMAINVVRVVEGFVLYQGTYPGGPTAFFADVTQWSFTFKTLLYLLQTLIGDGIVIFRCFIAWQSWKVVAFPIALWFAVAGGVSVYHTVCAYGDNYNQTTQSPRGNSVWALTYLVSTLVANSTGTFLLIYRLWSIGREVTLSAHQAALRHGDATPVYTRSLVTAPLVRIFADAGLLYSVTLVGVLLTYTMRNRGLYVLLDTPIAPALTFFLLLCSTIFASSQVAEARLIAFKDGHKQVTPSPAFMARDEQMRAETEHTFEEAVAYAIVAAPPIPGMTCEPVPIHEDVRDMEIDVNWKGNFMNTVREGEGGTKLGKGV
ncbi:hypothetical protein CONPUDRAFT_159641 [Coniophora puteana RWD-64-598 SS2]|uniref:Family A G protein-coupled receptor-like protein n=1 Tax=Coniophora puteana (strain RWD-64-598) TaxID=741705 RepID=A0A5M3M7W0_CONPW|nr:uncharacterized protein CONPUDRAFT_159641 [Coniophora puteana RWD-64-598 SS2]EIW74870.1 hypothetical protein CONPUDRAFT_159641 [Coniophora puteana RWD-64-598 SS2]